MYIRIQDEENHLALAIVMREAGKALITRADTQELLDLMGDVLTKQRVTKVYVWVDRDGEPDIMQWRPQ